MFAPRVLRETREGVERLRIVPRRNWKLAGSAFAALLLGTAKEAKPIGDFLKNPTDPFSDALMLLILAGWVFWLAAAVGEFFGSELVSIERGELIISRGIGPIRRTFRFKVIDIAGLCSDGPVTEEQAKPVLHHIFRKPELGAVQFEYGREIVHFAETLDEEGGEAIVRWLRPRLPRTATGDDYW